MGDYLIGAYQHEAHFPEHEKALRLLKKVASLVKPIMHHRRWSIRLLCEMYPADPYLLGLNQVDQQKISLRLRHPRDVREFLPLETVVDSMLHELCHIVIGPHDGHFHALWDELRREYAQLVQNGYAGDSSISRVERAGGRTAPIETARRIARETAQTQPSARAGPGQMPGALPGAQGKHLNNFISTASNNSSRIIQGCLHGAQLPPGSIPSTGGVRTTAAPDGTNQRAIMQAFMETVHQAGHGAPTLPPSIPFGIFGGTRSAPPGFPPGGPPRRNGGAWPYQVAPSQDPSSQAHGPNGTEANNNNGGPATHQLLGGNAPKPDGTLGYEVYCPTVPAVPQHFGLEAWPTDIIWY